MEWRSFGKKKKITCCQKLTLKVIDYDEFLFFFFQAEDGIRDFCLSRGLGRSVGIEMNLKSQGDTETVLNSTIDRMAELAYEDQCTTANPKEPLISELKNIIQTAYDYQGC